MAGNIPMGSMSTEVKLDGSQSVKTLRELKQAVTQATSAWKAQRAELSTIGKSTEAAEAKYKGLAETIKKQKDYISGLQEAQKHLTEAQKSVDRSTKEGRQEYGKYNEALQKNETRIHSAEQKLVSLTNQQTKAKSSLNYYKSGLADVQKQLKVNESVAKSYVVRLKAEGKGYESAKAKLNSYKDSLANLRKQQSIQNEELSRIARETGKSSDAYKRQEVRVNQTATSIAKLNSKIKSSQAEVNKLNPHGFNKLANAASKIKSHFDNVNKSGEKTHSLFKTIFSANVISNAATSAFGAVKGALGGMYQEAKQYALEQQTMNATWLTLTNSASKGKAMVSQINSMAVAAQNSTKMVDTLSQKFYAINNNAKQTGQLTKAILTLQDAFGQTDAAVENFGTQFSQMMANGKVSAQDMMSIVNTFPKLRPMLLDYERRIHHSSSMTMQELNKMMSDGKIKSQDMINVVLEAGKKFNKATGNFTKTIPGMTRVVKSQMPVLLGAFTKPLAKMESPVYAAVAKWVSSKKTNKEFQNLGKTVSTGMNSVMKSFSGGKTVNVTKALDSAINGINKGLKDVFGWISGHAKDLKTIGSSVASIGGQLAKAVWKDFASIITTIGNMFGLTAKNSKSSSGVIHVIAQALNSLAKNKTAIKAIADAIVAIAVVKGLDRVGGGLFAIGKKSYGAYRNIKALCAGIKGVQDIKDFKETEQGFFKIGQNANKAYKWVKSLFGAGNNAGKLKGALKSIHSAGGFKELSTAGKVATGVAGAGVVADAGYNAIFKAFQDRHSADKRSQDIGKGIGAGIGGGIGLWFGGPLGAALGAKIGGVVGKWGGQGVNQFTKGWQRQGKNQKPQNWVQWLGFQAHNSLDFFVGLGKKAITAVGKGFNNAKSFAKKNSKELALTAISPLIGIPTLLYKNNPKFRKWANSVGRNVKKGLKTAGKAVNSFKNSLGRKFKKAWDSAYKHSSKGTRQIMRSVSKFAKNYVKTNSKANRATLKNFSSFGARLKKNHGNLFKTLGQTAKKQLAIEKKRWSSNWKNIRSTAQGIWKGLNHNASDMYKKLNTATHGGLGKVLSGFKSFGKGIKDFWNGLWKGITKTFDDTVKGLQDAAGNVQKFFTGKLKVGNIHLAGGTDWRKRYGVPAIVNDAPGNNYREGLITNGRVIPFPAKRNLPIWLMPDQDIINGNDMAKMFGHAVHYADGTVRLSKDHKYSKKNYELAKKRAIEDKKELEKLGDKISNALKRKDGNEARRLTAEFNKLTKKYSADKKASKKPNPHAGKVLVDQGLLIGAKSRIGHSVYISKDLFKKLIANLNKKKTTTRRRTTTHKRRSTTARRTSTRRYSSRVTTPRISSGVSARISTVGLGSINGLSKALKGIKSKSIKVVAKASGTKAVASLAKSVGKVKGGSHKVTVKTSGLTSLRKLAKAANKIKGKTHKVRVRTSGTKGLKSLQKNITSVHKRIDSLSKASKKDKFGKAIAKQAEEAVKSLKGKGNFAKQFESMTKKFNKDLKNMTKNSKKEFKSMWSDIEHQSKTGQSRLTHEMSSFSSHYKKSWSSLENGVHRTFGQFWSKMKSVAGRGVNGVLRVVNSAIGKIDSVISDFGGSKRAVKSVTPVRYAEGTDANGRLTQDTLAIVNDAKSGPRQEAIVTDTNDVLLPRGKDVPVMLKKGWGVLNGTQTQQLGLPHFANGTGLKGLYELAKKYWNHPVKTGQSMFGAINGLTGAMKELASGMRSKSKDQGVAWWSQLWKMVEDKVNDDAVGKGGTREAFLKYAEKVFSGVHYQMGAASKTLSDCSGMVMQALRHFGINIGRTTVAMQESNGVQYLGKNIRKTVPGDLVIFGHGTGAAGHVGIVKNPKAGTMFNETQPYARVSRIADDVSMGYGFYRVKGLHNASDSNNPKVKANNSLQSLIKKQVGQGFWRTIQKIADKYGENSFFGGMAGKPVGDVTHWMRQAHIPKKDWAGINYIVTAESGWNPRIVNPSSGTYGLGQMQGYNLHYYTRHGSKSNPIAQLMGIMDYIHDRYGSVANAVRFRKAHNWYANGGIASTPSIFGEAGPEMAIPLIPSKSTRAWELIGKAIAILSGQSGFNLNQQQVVDTKEKKEEHDFRESVLFLLQQLVGKSDVAKITLQTPQGRTLWQVVEPFAKEENKKEIMRLKRGLSGRR